MFSIVLPCYNEENKLEESIDKLINYLEENEFKDYEIIIVNDGSTDNTLLKIIELQKIYSSVLNFITYKKNHGKGYAIKKGIMSAKKQYVIFMDIDLATDLEAIKNCKFYIENDLNSEFPILIASRRHPQSEILSHENSIRKMISLLCKIYTNQQLELNIKDTQCGFKCFKTNIAKQIMEKQKIFGFAFDAEILYIAKTNDIPIKEIPIKWSNGKDSRVHPIRDSIYFVKDLSKIKKNKYQYFF